MLWALYGVISSRFTIPLVCLYSSSRAKLYSYLIINGARWIYTKLTKPLPSSVCWQFRSWGWTRIKSTSMAVPAHLVTRLVLRFTYRGYPDECTATAWPDKRCNLSLHWRGEPRRWLSIFCRGSKKAFIKKPLAVGQRLWFLAVRTEFFKSGNDYTSPV